MMTITASTDSASRRRNDELDAAAAAPPPNDASRTAKSERPRENVEIGWDRRPTYPLHEPAFFRGIDLERMLAG
jgi:hypothetical protein